MLYCDAISCSLIEPDKISALISFVTDDPSQDVEEKVRFKYPHVACEILTAEVFSITEKLCDNEVGIVKARHKQLVELSIMIMLVGNVCISMLV